MGADAEARDARATPEPARAPERAAALSSLGGIGAAPTSIARLAVGAATDASEHEATWVADRVAEHLEQQVSRTTSRATSPPPARLRRSSSSFEIDTAGILRRRASGTRVIRRADDELAAAPAAPSGGGAVTVPQMVGMVFAAPPMLRKGLVRLGMIQRKPDFIVELAKSKAGRDLLDEMVNGSVSRWIPDAAMVMNVLTPLGTSGTPVQAVFGTLIGIPLAIAAVTVSSLQRAINMAWSARKGSHRDWIKELMEQEFAMTVSDTWSEQTMRMTYLAFHQVPAGTVRMCVDSLARETGVGSAASGSNITMATMLPTGLTMGALESLMRVSMPVGAIFGRRGIKFLKGSSDHSKKMKTKNAWTMTVLHEVGHTVDHKRRIMSTHGGRPDFGEWQDHTMSSIGADVLDAYTKTPEVTLNAADMAGIAVEQEGIAGRTQAKAAAKAEEVAAAEAQYVYDPAGRGDEDEQFSLFERRQKNRKRDARSKWEAENVAAQGHQRQIEAINQGAENRAWTARHRVTREMLRVAITEAASKREPMKKIATVADYVAMDAGAKRQAKQAIETHPAVTMVKANAKGEGWSRSDADMARMSADFGGRYFQRSYPGADNKVDEEKWVSFQVASRKDAVSHYQYRAAGEWFAELYAHYYLGTLEGHPLYTWFKEKIDVPMSPDMVLGVPAPDAEEDEEEDDAAADEPAALDEGALVEL